jgi:hypothetical protein
LTAQGAPRAGFKRAIEGGWVFHAELAAREAGNLTLAEALELVCVYAEAEPAKFARAALQQPGRVRTADAPRLPRSLFQLDPSSRNGRRIVCRSSTISRRCARSRAWGRTFGRWQRSGLGKWVRR